MRVHNVSASALVLAFIGVSAAGLAAETPPKASPAASAPHRAASAAPVSESPDQTTATYGDWVLRCARTRQTGAPAVVCEVAETITAKEGQQPIAQVAIGQISKADPLHMTVVLPINISIPFAPKIHLGGKDAEVLALQWQRCIPAGCFAFADVSETTLDRLRGQTGQGRIEFRDAAQRDLAIPLSFRGLPQALDALART